ncbi:MAG: TIGR00303 family protein [Synechocystis sp.]|nr:TIGR00303 family protein [Synechocystis sp.]
MLTVYTQSAAAHLWLDRYRHRCPVFSCVLGFTATGLIPGISAAGKTPADRRYTAIADAEFLLTGKVVGARYPLPPLTEGVSPVFITRAVIDSLKLPTYLFNAGLPTPPVVTAVDLRGQAANCVSTGQALPLTVVKQLFDQGLTWGANLAHQYPDTYLIISECVVGGTTTALGVLTGLGIDAQGKVNSSHPTCNHQQKRDLVQTGLKLANHPTAPFAVVAAVGDPMQIVVAGMAIAASQTMGVLLAGGTQMLAVYGLMQGLVKAQHLTVDWSQIVVGTTRWVCEDASADCVGLAELLAPVPLISTTLSFANSPYAQLQMYEQGFVKEGVGAGGAAIAAYLYKNWGQAQLQQAIEALLVQSMTLTNP